MASQGLSLESIATDVDENAEDQVIESQFMAYRDSK
jgi:hypothetical protein